MPGVAYAAAGRDALLERESEEGEEAIDDVRKSLGFWRNWTKGAGGSEALEGQFGVDVRLVGTDPDVGSESNEPARLRGP
jgi:hypothetical protein